MTNLRTAAAALLMALAAAPAFAQSFSFDLPRLDFPTAPEATRACTDMTAPSTCGQNG